MVFSLQFLFKSTANKLFKHLNIESTPKSHKTPKSPKGDFCKILIFSFFPLGVGVEKS